jgi:poly-gamma-glutamate synthesis protein (capsule biosynthesis protein)
MQIRERKVYIRHLNCFGRKIFNCLFPALVLSFCITGCQANENRSLLGASAISIDEAGNAISDNDMGTEYLTGAVGVPMTQDEISGDSNGSLDIGSNGSNANDNAADGDGIGSSDGNAASDSSMEISDEEIPSSDSPVALLPNEYSFDIKDGGDTATVVFGGDVLFSEGYAIIYSIARNGGTIEGVIDQGLLDCMRGADICMVNNEFPYTLEGAPLEGKTWTFHANPSSVHYLFDMGVDIVSIGNNHIFDYGAIGLSNTLSTLESVSMPYVGAGRNLEEASRTVYFNSASGIRIAFISGCDIEGSDPPFTRGATDTQSGVFRVRQDELLCQRVMEAKASGAFVVVYMHWGLENTLELNYLQKNQSADLANAGADLIIGDHPHILQNLDYVNGVPVIYSMGNYLFNSKTLDTGLIEAKIGTEGLISWRFIPGIQSNSTVRMAYGDEKSRIINFMQSISPRVVIDGDGYIYPNN